MATRRITPLKVVALRLVLGMGVSSLLAFVIVLGFGREFLGDLFHACVGTSVLALIGSVAGLWSAARMRSRMVLLASLPAVLALAGWLWFLHPWARLL